MYRVPDFPRAHTARSTLPRITHLEPDAFAARLRDGSLTLTDVGAENAYACDAYGVAYFAKGVPEAELSRYTVQPHAQIVARVGLGNNGWSYRMCLTPDDREAAERAVAAGLLLKVFRELPGHLIQPAYAVPRAVEAGS